MLKICIPVIILFAMGCSGNDSSKNKKTADKPEVQVAVFPAKELFIDTADGGGWGADVRLSIVKITATDTSTSYFLNSSSGGKNIGFQVTIPAAVPDDKKANTQTLVFNSSGAISDNFISVLSKLYKEKPDTSLHFASFKKASFIDLDEFAKKEFGKVADNSNGIKALKLFFENGNDNDYAEIFININEQEKWIALLEKDESYRKQVLKALTSK